jgi:hypothetical protein
LAYVTKAMTASADGRGAFLDASTNMPPSEWKRLAGLSLIAGAQSEYRDGNIHHHDDCAGRRRLMSRRGYPNPSHAQEKAGAASEKTGRAFIMICHK